MQNDTNPRHKKSHPFWLFSPYYALLTAIITLSINNHSGLDGAARSTAVVFWFSPVILYAGYRSIVELHKTTFSKLKKIFFVLVWVIPSIPIGLISLFGMILLSETGLGILIR